jgi:hypothetical protein
MMMDCGGWNGRVVNDGAASACVIGCRECEEGVGRMACGKYVRRLRVNSFISTCLLAINVDFVEEYLQKWLVYQR